jgi:hypothetical protein
MDPHTAMIWIRQSDASLSLQRPELVPESIHVGNVVNKVTVGQAFVQVLWFSPVNIIPPWFSILMYHPGEEQ